MNGLRRASRRMARIRCAGALLACAAALLAFAPRGSQTLAYLAEQAALIAVGKVDGPASPMPHGAAWHLTLEAPLKGKAPRGPVTVWVLGGSEDPRLEAGKRALFFLSPVPNRAAFRQAGVAGKGWWLIAGSEAGVGDPALSSVVADLLSALRAPDRGFAIVHVLVAQAAHPDVRVREDAAADLDRRCPAGCRLNAAERAKIQDLAARAPAGSPYRASLLRAAGVGRGPRGGGR